MPLAGLKSSNEYVLVDRSSETLERWHALLLHNARYADTAKLLERKRLSTAADMVAAQEHATRCEQALARLSGTGTRKGLMKRLAGGAASGVKAAASTAQAAQRRLREEAKRAIDEFTDESDTSHGIKAAIVGPSPPP